MTAPLPASLEPIEFEVRLLHARLDRAEEHYKSFGQIWADYLSQRPHALDRSVEDDGTVVARLRRVVPLPVELSVVFGELLYELRAALDNCLYAVAVLVSGQNPPPSATRLEWQEVVSVQLALWGFRALQVKLELRAHAADLLSTNSGSIPRRRCAR